MIKLDSEVIKLVEDVFCLFLILHPCLCMLRYFGLEVKRKVLGVSLSPSCSLSLLVSLQWFKSLPGLNYPQFCRHMFSARHTHTRPLPQGPVRRVHVIRFLSWELKSKCGNSILDGCLTLIRCENPFADPQMANTGRIRYRTSPPSGDLLDACACVAFLHGLPNYFGQGKRKSFINPSLEEMICSREVIEKGSKRVEKEIISISFSANHLGEVVNVDFYLLCHYKQLKLESYGQLNA